MTNFFRAMQFAWPYRWQFGLSVLCAIMVALLWGANLSAIYPFLKLLSEDKTPQGWAAGEVTKAQEKLADATKEVQRVEKIKQNLVKGDLVGKDRDDAIQKVESDLAKKQLKEAECQSSLAWSERIKNLVDGYCPNDSFTALMYLMGLVIAGVAIKGIFDFWQEFLVGNFVFSSVFALRNKLFRQVLSQDVKQFTEEGTASIQARFTTDAEAFGVGLKTLCGRMVGEPLKALVCIILACTVSWRLTLTFLILVPIAALFMNWVGKKLRLASKKLFRSMAGMYQVLQQSLLSVKVVKAFNAEHHERHRFFKNGQDFKRKGMKFITLEAISDPIMEWLAITAVAGALLLGAFLVINQRQEIWGIRFTSQPLEAPGLLALYGLLVAIADPLRKLSNVFSKLQSAVAAADRIYEVMDRKPVIRNAEKAVLFPRLEKALEFRDICFGYQPGQPVLSHINFTVKAGETIAIVGKNGCGKSTLMGLLTRFHDPDHGNIYLDGIDLRNGTLRSLRRQIGTVTQETILFADTIAANIAYGKRHIPQSEIEAASKAAHAHDFICKLPNGYKTVLGEGGSTLSGGQRQRLALARAILRNPAILILDEATSAADSESEHLIHQALVEFAKTRTTFLITHRLGTLAHISDRIIVLNQGKVEAIGSHTELLKTCETYQRLHDLPLQRRAA